MVLPGKLQNYLQTPLLMPPRKGDRLAMFVKKFDLMNPTAGHVIGLNQGKEFS
jgi:hypothetical protein